MNKDSLEINLENRKIRRSVSSIINQMNINTNEIERQNEDKNRLIRLTYIFNPISYVQKIILLQIMIHIKVLELKLKNLLNQETDYYDVIVKIFSFQEIVMNESGDWKNNQSNRLLVSFIQLIINVDQEQKVDKEIDYLNGDEVKFYMIRW